MSLVRDFTFREYPMDARPLIKLSSKLNQKDLLNVVIVQISLK
jgi:hypothetical protein